MKSENELMWNYTKDGYFNVRFNYVEKHLRRLGSALPKKGKSVDLGCGDGPGALALALRGLSVVAIDYDTMGKKLEEAQQRAREYGVNTQFTVGKRQKLSYPENREILYIEGGIETDLELPSSSADLVTFFHIEPPKNDEYRRRIFSEGARILKRNSLFIVTVNREGFIEIIRQLLDGSGMREIIVSETPEIIELYPDSADRYLVAAKK
ncbi:MAG: methyltransferase domain-containing protein [Candidatus Woesebacteria bacterium]|nr:methyltransferase domain-containing protein [Candidatus Woesebacteria bacterium]